MSDRIWQAAYFVAVWLICWLAGWHGWMTLAAIAVAVAGVFALNFTVAFVSAAIRDIRPRGVPPELTGQYVKLEAAGWRLARVHPWWACEEERPHAHLVMPGADRGARKLIMVWDGVTTLDESGNVLRHEP